MRIIKFLSISLAAAAVLTALQLGNAQLSRAQEGYDYINISNPFLKKIPVAVPVFRCMTDIQKEKETASRAAEILTEGLDFTGYFNIIDRGAYLENLQEKGITADGLNFKNWQDVGADLLVTGGLWKFGDAAKMEIRLFDTLKGEMLFGKRYKGSSENLRKMIHRFCGEMVKRLTGREGLFKSRIVFISKNNGKSAVYTCDFDGSFPEKIAESSSITLFPSWSPDCRSIAYTSYSGENPNITVKDLTTGSTRSIAYEGVNITPKWLPEGKSMAATLSIDGDEEIYLLTESGKIDKRLTNSWGIDVSPTFSPDGEKMAFVSKRAGSPQIYIKDLDDGTVRRLTFEGGYNTEPDWSPEGDRIVFSSMNGGRADIFVIGADGEGLKQLTRNAGSNESPSWSPDGSLIVFSSNRSGTSKLYVMTASGTDQRLLLEMSGKQILPEWSPPQEKG